MGFKKTTGEIVSVEEITEKKPLKIKNFGPNATAIWEPVTALVPTPSRLFALSPWRPARPADLLSSKCTTPRSNSLCLLAYRSPRDHFSRPTDQTHTFCKLLFPLGF